MPNDAGYVNYFEILDLPLDSRPGDVRKQYKKLMKDLVTKIQEAEITDDLRSKYILEMAKLNAALLALRETVFKDAYWAERQELIELEEKWRQADAAKSPEMDALRRQFDSKIRHFLARFVEELMLDAGRDKEVIEACRWDAAHERYASTILRRYRHGLYHQILERLPYFEVTRPAVDWDERSKTVARLLAEAK
jgi:hypothetical protein